MTVKDQNLQEFKASYGDRGDLPDPVATPSTGKLNGAHKDALEPAPKVGEAEPH